MVTGLVGGASDVTLLGVVLAAFSAIGWAAYILLAAATGARFGGTQGLSLATVIAATLCVPTAL
jgi:inner membrane transporter RhtA